MNFTMNFTTRSARTFGSSTEGEGSERYQIVKKMVIAGALSGSHNSLRYSGLFIGTATASKYRAALIRDGIIQGKNDSQQNTCNNKKQTPEIILGDEISETTKFDDFENFVIGKWKELMDSHKESGDDAEFNKALNYYSVIDVMKEFNRRVEDIETSLMRFGHSRGSFYRTGYLVEKGRATIEEKPCGVE